MKLTVKTLKGTHFEIRVQPNDTVRYSDPHFVLKSSRASYRGASYRGRVRGCERLWRGGWFLRHSDAGGIQGRAERFAGDVVFLSLYASLGAVEKMQQGIRFL